MELELDLENPYRIRIESKEKFKTSIFNNVYNKAESLLNEIVEGYEKSRNIELDNNIEYNNNIIVFSGERGTGKTSSMLSFSESLDKEKFEVLKILEPSNFEKNTDILELIIADIFSNFKKKMNVININEKREMIKLFEKLYKNLKTVNEDKKKFYENENLDNLLNMSELVEFKETLKGTIEKYLDISSKYKKSENRLLIIMIDDLDLSSENHFDILEKIRRYLILPNIVVLISFKKEQFLEEIEKKFEKNQNKKDAAQKYFNKLFPFGRIIEMPEEILQRKLNDENIRDIFKPKNKKEIFEEVIDGKIEDIFVRLLNKKLYYDNLLEEEIEIFLPVTIRETIGQLIFLKNLDDKSLKIEEYIERISNKNTLEKINEYKNMDSEYLHSTNWIEKIKEIDKNIIKEENFKEKKEKMIEKIFLINFLDRRLMSIESCFPENFSLIRYSGIENKVLMKKDYSIIEPKMVEFISSFIRDKNLDMKTLKIYEQLVENNRFDLKNTIKAYLGYLYKIRKKYRVFKSLYIMTKMIDLEEWIEPVSLRHIFEMAGRNINPNLKCFSRIFYNRVEKIEKDPESKVYIEMLLFMNNDIFKNLYYINKDVIIDLLKNLINFSSLDIGLDILIIGSEDKLISKLEKFRVQIDEFISLFEIERFEINQEIRMLEKLLQERRATLRKNEITIKKGIISQNVKSEKIDKNHHQIRKLSQKLEDERKALEFFYRKMEEIEKIDQSFQRMFTALQNRVQKIEIEIKNYEEENFLLKSEIERFGIEISDFKEYNNTSNLIEISEKVENIYFNLKKKFKEKNIEIPSYTEKRILEKWLETLVAGKKEDE